MVFGHGVTNPKVSLVPSVKLSILSRILYL